MRFFLVWIWRFVFVVTMFLVVSSGCSFLLLVLIDNTTVVIEFFLYAELILLTIAVVLWVIWICKPHEYEFHEPPAFWGLNTLHSLIKKLFQER